MVVVVGVERVSEVTARGSGGEVKDVGASPVVGMRLWGHVWGRHSKSQTNPTECFLSWQSSDIALVDSLQIHICEYLYFLIYGLVFLFQRCYSLFLTMLFERRKSKLHAIASQREEDKRNQNSDITIYQVITPEVSYRFVFFALSFRLCC
jgi:hypothetical protein